MYGKVIPVDQALFVLERKGGRYEEETEQSSRDLACNIILHT